VRLVIKGGRTRNSRSKLEIKVKLQVMQMLKRSKKAMIKRSRNTWINLRVLDSN
jgi:hypothetical protein